MGKGLSPLSTFKKEPVSFIEFIHFLNIFLLLPSELSNFANFFKSENVFKLRAVGNRHRAAVIEIEG